MPYRLIRWARKLDPNRLPVYRVGEQQLSLVESRQVGFYVLRDESIRGICQFGRIASTDDLRCTISYDLTVDFAHELFRRDQHDTK